MKKLIMVFIDGFGIAGKDGHNTLKSNEFPTLFNICHRHSIPIDAIMGVSGIPQSATGQTSLFCGINAQKILSRHKEGFPGPALKKLIAHENIFKKLKQIGKTATFANGYWLHDINSIDKRLEKKMSVTTVAALTGIGGVRTMERLIQGEAVYQDITQELLLEKGATLPRITEMEAAKRLIRISKEFDFTLFEYFQTDVAGHSGDLARIRRILGILERFLSALMRNMDFRSHGLLITSDHGNIEDASTARHTLNPVPCFFKGPDKKIVLENIRDLSGVVPGIITWFTK